MQQLQKIAAVLFMAALLAGCSPEVYTHRIIHGSNFRNKMKSGGEWRGNYEHEDPYDQTRKGYPQASVNAMGYVSLEGRPSLLQAANILRANLTFPDGQPAAVAIRMHITSSHAADSTINSQLTIAKHPNRISCYYQKQLHVPPGKYTIKFQLSDRAAGRTVERTARTIVPTPEPDTTRLGNVRMAVKDLGGWRPQPAYSVPGRVDSLRFTIRVTHDSTHLPLIVWARLVRFAADSTPARWNHLYSDYPSQPSSLVYRGIDYGDSTAIHRDRRTLAQAGAVEIRFQFRRPPRGNYRFVVQAGGGRLKGRAFAMRSPSFPAVRTPRERAAPLIYLMCRDSLRRPAGMKALLRKVAARKRERSFSRIKTDTKTYRALTAIEGSDSLVATVTHFWQSHIGDSTKARHTAALYYQRVRAANILFSNYKEGWKTPRGMIYILCGPPTFIWHYKPSIREGEIGWCYRDNDRAPGGGYDNAHSGGKLSAIDFFPLRPQSFSFPFQQFFLDDPPGYLIHEFAAWFHHKQHLWLSGKILREKIYYYDSGAHRVGYWQTSDNANINLH